MRHEYMFDWSGYFEWLVEIVRGEDEEYVDLIPVLDFLFDRRFEWHNTLDRNRVADALLLRRDYAKEEGCAYPADSKEKECSVFEVLVRLAVDVDDHITGDPEDPHPEIWFWKWLENLGIDDRCTGEGYDEEYLEQQISRWLKGDFSSLGKGSPFRLHHRAGDQRKKDMWGQCMAYISEVEHYW